MTPSERKSLRESSNLKSGYDSRLATPNWCLINFTILPCNTEHRTWGTAINPIVHIAHGWTFAYFERLTSPDIEAKNGLSDEGPMDRLFPSPSTHRIIESQRPEPLAVRSIAWVDFSQICLWLIMSAKVSKTHEAAVLARCRGSVLSPRTTIAKKDQYQRATVRSLATGSFRSIFRYPSSS